MVKNTISNRIYRLGCVKWFDAPFIEEKGRRYKYYGFIQDMGGKDVFVHISETKSHLFEGQLVIFEIGKRKGKSCAKNVYEVSENPEVLKLFLDVYCTEKDNYPKFFNSYPIKSSLKNLLSIRIFKNMDEKDFLEALEIIAPNDPSYCFSKIDEFITERKKLGKELTTRILNIKRHISFRDFISSKNRSYYLSITKIKELIIERLYDEFDNLYPEEISILISEKILDYESFMLNPIFLDYAFNNIKSNEEFFSILKISIKSGKRTEILKALKKTKNWFGIFNILFENLSIQTLLQEGIPLDLIPSLRIEKGDEEIFDFLKQITELEKVNFIKEYIEIIPDSVVLASLINGIKIDDGLIHHRLNSFRLYFINYVRGTKETLSDFLITILKNAFKNLKTLLKDSNFKIILEPIIFKSLLHQKKTIMMRFYENSLTLQNSIEHFLLAKFFSLILAKNDINLTYQVFLNEVWGALKDQKIDITDKGLFNLFPSCRIMGYNNLSCEAFYWPNNDVFLCRGRICRDPQILPDINKHYLVLL